jgi:hypothetical protein
MKKRYRRLITLLTLFTAAVAFILTWAWALHLQAQLSELREALAAIPPPELAIVHYHPEPGALEIPGDNDTDWQPSPAFQLLAGERSLVESVVMAEAGNQPFEGLIAVAQCIRDAAEKDGLTVDEVIAKYQYTGNRPQPSQVAVDAVKAVFDDGERATAEKMYWFYNPDIVASAWHEAQTFVAEIGDHRFFR